MKDSEIISRNIAILKEAAEIKKGNIKIRPEHEFYKDIIINDHMNKLKMVEMAMDVLSNEEQQLIYLRYFKGLSYRKIEEILFINRNSVKKRLEMALVRMRLITYV